MKYPLRHIVFEITQECNLSCLYCYNHWRRNDSPPQVSTFRQTQRTLRKLFNTVDFQYITFTGSEPFLADGLNEFILNCRMKSKGVNVISNGTVADRSGYQVLIDLGVSLIEVPLHAELPAIHDGLTCVPGSHKKVLESIRFLRETKVEICVICVLTKLNINYMQSTLEFAYRLGVKYFMLARLNIGGRGIGYLKKIIPSLSELHSAFHTANDFVQRNKMKISANVCVPHCIINHEEYPNIPISSCGSNITERPITIDSFGNVRMCNHSPYIIGNIHADSMNSIFKSEYVKSWQTTIPIFCKDCDRLAKCMGGCRAASEQLGRSLKNEDPIIEFMNSP